MQSWLRLIIVIPQYQKKKEKDLVKAQVSSSPKTESGSDNKGKRENVAYDRSGKW